MVSNKDKPDFSAVSGGFGSTGKPADTAAAETDNKAPGFSGVQGGFQSADTAPATAPNDITTYTVKAGDSLSAIARSLYGAARYWPLIHDANRDLIPDPDMIHPGQVLTIPPTPRNDANDR